MGLKATTSCVRRITSRLGLVLGAALLVCSCRLAADVLRLLWDLRAKWASHENVWRSRAIILAGVMGLVLGYADYAVVGDAICSKLAPTHHYLGTDHSGRDVFKRLVMSSQSFMGPGLKAAMLAMLIGTTWGLSGYMGGCPARLTSSTFSILGAIPRLILALLCSAILGPNPTSHTRPLSLTHPLWEAIDGELKFATTTVCHRRGVTVSHWRILSYHFCGSLSAPNHSTGSTSLRFYVVLEATLSHIPHPFLPTIPDLGQYDSIRSHVA